MPKNNLQQCGALWLRKSKKGTQFLSGVLKGPYGENDSPLGLQEDVNIIIFKNINRIFVTYFAFYSFSITTKKMYIYDFIIIFTMIFQ